jgi:hypothetical protein
MVTTEVSPPVGRLRQLQSSLNSQEWRRTRWMFGSIVALHLLGFGIFIAFVVPGHYRGLGIGVSVLATHSGCAMRSTLTTSRRSITPRAS